jgi:hypothetical protein
MQTTTEFQLEPLPAPHQVLRHLSADAPTMAQTFTLLYATRHCRIARVQFEDPGYFSHTDANVQREILIMAEGPKDNLLVTLWADNGLLGSLLAFGTSNDRTVRVTRLFQCHAHHPSNTAILELFHHVFDGGIHRLP